MEKANTTGKKGSLLLWVFGLYFSAGNLARFISVPGFSDNLLITEGLLYLCAFFFVFFQYRRIPKTIGFFIILVSIGYLIGFLQQGFALKPTLYAIRLVLMVVSAYAVGLALYSRYGNDWLSAFHFINACFVVILIIGFFFYFFFSNSVVLWATLAQFGVEFNGDPHEHRFYSVILDPNYYSSIALIGLVTSFASYQKNHSLKSLLLSAVLLLTVFLSKSRSGFASMALLLALYLLPRAFRFILYNVAVRKKVIIGIITFVLFAVIVCVIRPEIILPVITRILNSTSGDSSTMHRFDSFFRGIEIILEHPHGIGYHFYSVFFPHDLSALDSSVLNLLVDFGVFLFPVVCFLVIWLMLSFFRKRRCFADDHGFYCFIELFTQYMFISVIWTSLFNNLLLFQFWLLPTGAILTYSYKVTGNKS
jgi:hypothetical protein